ncbi:hypothetical protein [Teredinibacter sp. KSP-S5-2]|uniref:hypothetical protein n=1 Tax=Teredinibacter sp. KSP-S5-2 TaxID=3034506 RepID=UPI0029346BED|nr:hypothetical protein [Teredinibacter sp. KSP-S5-2]WNO10804.1 hypothetical protein P5V12_06400 [Teredinibacter sp. KSP-S5-2]
MWYKRFGFKFPQGRSGAETFLIVLVPPVAIFLVGLLAGITQNFYILWLIVPAIIGGFELVDRLFVERKSRIRIKRRKMHIKNTLKYINSGRIDQAKESLRRAKLYGELPEELKEIDRRLTQLTSTE